MNIYSLFNNLNITTQSIIITLINKTLILPYLNYLMSEKI